MNLLVQGSSTFSDYPVIIRAMGVALSDVTDELTIYSLGPHKLNENLREFVNKTEGSLKSRGIKIKLIMVPVSRAVSINVDKMYYFCNNGEKLSAIGHQFDTAGKEVLVFRF